LEFDKER